MRAARAATFGTCTFLWYDLLPDRADPVTLQQLSSTGSSLRVAFEASLEEVYPLLTQLLSAWQLRWVALGDIVHNCPLVVKACPRTAASAHFEDDAAKRPDIYRTEAAFVGAFNDFRGHVHGGAGHGLLLCRNFREAGSACSSEWCFVGRL